MFAAQELSGRRGEATASAGGNQRLPAEPADAPLFSFPILIQLTAPAPAVRHLCCYRAPPAQTMRAINVGDKGATAWHHHFVYLPSFPQIALPHTH